MPSDYYTSYIPCITATPKEDFIPIGSTNRNQVGGRKLLSTSRIVLYIAETMKNRTIPFVLVWFCVSISSFFLIALKNIRILCLGFLCFMLFNLSDAWAQSAETRAAEGQTEIKPLQIGDTIPKELWNMPLQVVNHPEGKDTITLNDYRDKKLIILDFWATWCKSCIEGFPNLSRLQKEFPEQLDVLLVNTVQTKDTPAKVQQLLGRYKKVHDYDLDLPYLLEDTLFQQLFRHKIIPHVVWLDGDLRFIGASHSYEVTTKNITDFLENGRIDFFQKDDYGTANRGESSSDDIEVSRFYRYQDGPRSKTLKTDTVGDYVNYNIVNQPLSYMIELAWGMRNVPKSLWIFPESPDGDRLRRAIRRLSSNPPIDLFCYTFKTSNDNSFDVFRRNFRQDLQDFLGYQITVQEDSVKVRVLKPTQRLAQFKTTGGILQSQTNPENMPMYLQNVHITGLQMYLSNLFREPTLVGKHDIDVAIDFELPDNLYELSDTDLESLVQAMGFDVIHETRLVTTYQFTEIL